jgi:hypothetical protein
MTEVVVTGISRRSKDSFTGNYVEVKGDFSSGDYAKVDAEANAKVDAIKKSLGL